MLKSQNKKVLAFVGVLIVVILGGVYWFYNQEAPYTGPRESLTVAVSRLEATTLVRVAEEQGFFDEQGLDITFIEDDLGKFSLKRVLDGEADIATTAEFPVVKQAFDRDDVRLIGTIHSSNKNVRLLTRDPITDIPSVVGKRIATTTGTVGEFFLHLLLLAHNIDPSDVNIVNMTPQEINVAIDAGTIDGFALREPHVYLAERRLGDSTIVFPVNPVDQVYTATFNLVGLDEMLAAKPATVSRFLKAVSQAEKHVRRNGDATRAFIAEDLGLDKTYLDETWADSDFSLHLNQALIVGMEDEARWRIQQGLTDSTTIPNFLDVVATEYLLEANPSAVSIIEAN